MKTTKNILPVGQAKLAFLLTLLDTPAYTDNELLFWHLHAAPVFTRKSS